MPVNEKFPLALPEGTVLAGQYTIEKVLGQGGFGISYKARDHKNNIDVAIKEFFPDTLAYREQTNVISYPGERSDNYEYGKQMFLEEAKTLSMFIGCENIVRIYSYFEENHTAYFVMEFIEGVSFDRYISDHGGKIGYEDAKRILIPIMDALAAVHSQGIIHRDVTPDNIYITKDGTVKLLDFGAARYSLGDKSRSLDVILKHGFAPKEQYTRHGRQGPYTDVYSLGATFYYALTGRRPPDSVDRMEEDDLVPPSTLGATLTDYEEQAILQALNVQPSERFQTMTAFKTAFMDENAHKSAPQQTGAVQQQFFSAPVGAVPVGASQPQFTQSAQPAQPVGQMTQPAQPIQPTQPAQASEGLGQPAAAVPGAVPVQGQTTGARGGFDFRKLLDKKILIPSAALIVVVVGCIIAVSAVVNSSKNAGIIDDGQNYQSDAGDSYQSDAGDPYQSDNTDNSSQGIDQVNMTDQTSSTPTPEPETVQGDTEIIGNFSSIQNGGLICNEYYLDNDMKLIRATSDNKEVASLNNVAYNLCYDKDNNHLYFLFNGANGYQVVYYSLGDGQFYSLPCLDAYSGISAFYLTKDYYFIYISDPTGASGGYLCRISRSTGTEEQRLKVTGQNSFAIGAGNVTYLSSDSRTAVCVSALDFNNVISSCSYNETSSYFFNSVTYADNSFYLLGMYPDGYGLAVERYNSSLNEKYSYYNLSALVDRLKQANEPTWYAYSLCVLDGHFAFTVSSLGTSGDFKYSKYVVTPSSETSFVQDTIFEDLSDMANYDVLMHSFAKSGDDLRMYWFYTYPSDNGVYYLYYREYDNNGNRL